MVKTFMLDTNVLLHNPQALTSFGDNRVVIPIGALEEMDQFKKLNDEKGKHARQVSRFIDGLRAQGSIAQGVKMENGGILQVLVEFPENRLPGLDPAKIDNQIIALALALKERTGEDVRIVTKDVNMRVKADALGITAEDFEKNKVKIEELYSGVTKLPLPAEDINKFAAEKRLTLSQADLFPNQFVILKDEAGSSQSLVGKMKWPERVLVPLTNSDQEVWGIKAKNLQQRLAMELLLDDTIPLVTLVGPAGTGKTLLAVAAALRKTLDEKAYRKILVSRPVIPLGRDIGFLPGSKEEKLQPWMQPIFDNLEFLMDQNGDSGESGEGTLRYMLETGKIVLEAVTYIRGRTLPKQFIIIDEAQNLTPHEVKTIVSRAGDETKVVLTGDPYQIDNPYLDSNSNGLTYLVELFKSQHLAGHVTLYKSERSALAALAAKIL
ncbi:MAG: PhoH family protein [Candidatus Firestonebacteria bacterium]|nr:PhoH family protein [Candidatus Firestonebacteria bacterium]